ncbi:hypothetical protein STCU_10236 [Strigomonas culicis]|uniref:Uncharacterized protein n=1 Tax=Strigomonas culicis TaxID=28005 RepID=S9TMN5_9TRYP|nr:hypothetical protein STCU_10236 [Strigomonas culicis]|eukprot:EPY18029.1 hypothetical protein STCU_10236 [Strigomonas culicis]
MLALLRFSRRDRVDTGGGAPSVASDTNEAPHRTAGDYLVEGTPLPPFHDRFQFFESRAARPSTPVASGHSEEPSAIRMVFRACEKLLPHLTTAQKRPSELAEVNRLPSLGEAERQPVPALPTALRNNYLCEGDAHGGGRQDAAEDGGAPGSPVRLPAVRRSSARELHSADANSRTEEDINTYFFYTNLLLAAERGIAPGHPRAATPNLLTTHATVLCPPQGAESPTHMQPSHRRHPQVGFTDSTEFVPAFKSAKTH